MLEQENFRKEKEEEKIKGLQRKNKSLQACDEQNKAKIKRL